MDRLERRQSSSGPSLGSSPDAQPPLDLVSPGARAADGGPLLPGPLLAHSFKQHVYLSVFQLPQLEELTWAWDHQTLNAFVISFCVAHPDQVWRLKYSSFRQSLPFCLSIDLSRIQTA